MVKTIYLFRHAQTDYNAKRCFYGSLDVSINAYGKKQVQSVHSKLQDVSVDEVFTSTLVRTIETANILFPSHEPTEIALFNEKGFGLWEGLTADQIQEQFPLEWQAWIDNPFTVTPPEAEPFSQFKERVTNGLQSVLATENETIAIVAHLGVLRLIYQLMVDHQAVFWDIDFPQDAITMWQLYEDRWCEKRLYIKES